MFLPNDIYTTSGSVKLYHCWTDKVTKFDSSSFYNWEQDNLPVYDLDERTHYLWEQLGYPTSSIPGVALVVSADASDSQVTCNKNIFRTVSAAIAALPQVINYPIIIEIANFGDLGELTLNNYKFGPRGSLEIINRNFSKQECALSGLVGISFPQTSGDYYLGTDAKYVSSFTLNDLGAQDGYEKTSPLQGFLDSSCLSISASVFSSTYDSRLSGTSPTTCKLNAYISAWKTSSNYNRATLVVDTNNTFQPYRGNEHELAFQPYAYNNTVADDLGNKDALIYNYYINSFLVESNGETVGYNAFRAFNGLYYGNKLSKIYVNNCDGPIYIRNFFLNGKGASVTNNIVGVEINNSPNIFLENIVSVRYRKAGFRFTNSTVNILRGCVANRIYDFDSQGVRITGNFSDRAKYLTYADTSGYLREDNSAGLISYNSHINFSSTRAWEESNYEQVLAGTSTSALPVSYQIFEFNDNSNGMILNNSTLVGGDSFRESTADISGIVDQSYFDFNKNVGCGLIVNNSTISLNGRIRAVDNLNGIRINSSQFDFEELELKRNQIIGLELNDSKVTYNKNLRKSHINGARRFMTFSKPIQFVLNGTHLSLNRSSFAPAATSGMELLYNECIIERPLGTFVSSIIGEQIKVDNNSYLNLISPKIVRGVHTGPVGSTYSRQDTSKIGSEINCTNNSKVTIRGTRFYPTRIIGPDVRSYQKNLAAVAATNNSTVEINGPTVIAQFGVDLLADNNSTINICPPKSQFDGKIDVSSISLSAGGNHTMVELHSTRACIVVDKNSTLNMKDLGSFRQNWSATLLFDPSGPDYGGDSDNILNTTYVSGGSLQFYPNPNMESPNSAPVVTGTALVNTAFIKYSNGFGFLKALNLSPLEFSTVTFGGMCVRALNNSIVNVHNVNFPCGFWNPSAPYYDEDVTFDSGGACYRPFIWNIADQSQLKSSFLSVSGKYPRLAGYVGPYGYWKLSNGNAASGAPSGTPDTSSTSILDIFGANPSGLAFTNVTATNYGPFRLYFGVNPMINSLVEHTGDGEGIIEQIYSQGYQPSSTLVCSGDPSSIYRMALQRNSNNVIAPSGFYYGSGVMDTQGYLRVMLDESSAETFANAKHCAAGRSGNARLVSIYYPYKDIRYGDSSDSRGVASVNLFDIERDN